MTAPTSREERDDDLTVPVSELLAEHGNPFRDIPQQQDDTAPLRIDVSIAVYVAMFAGVATATVASYAPNSYLICWIGMLIIAQLLIKWTRKR